MQPSPPQDGAAAEPKAAKLAPEATLPPPPAAPQPLTGAPAPKLELAEQARQQAAVRELWPTAHRLLIGLLVANAALLLIWRVACTGLMLAAAACAAAAHFHFRPWTKPASAASLERWVEGYGIGVFVMVILIGFNASMHQARMIRVQRGPP